VAIVASAPRLPLEPGHRPEARRGHGRRLAAETQRDYLQGLGADHHRLVVEYWRRRLRSQPGDRRGRHWRARHGNRRPLIRQPDAPAPATRDHDAIARPGRGLRTSERPQPPAFPRPGQASPREARPRPDQPAHSARHCCQSGFSARNRRACSHLPEDSGEALRRVSRKCRIRHSYDIGREIPPRDVRPYPVGTRPRREHAWCRKDTGWLSNLRRGEASRCYPPGRLHVRGPSPGRTTQPGS
jgi:hypothetical protein